jgi:hypothetical protein
MITNNYSLDGSSLQLWITNLAHSMICSVFTLLSCIYCFWLFVTHCALLLCRSSSSSVDSQFSTCLQAHNWTAHIQSNLHKKIPSTVGTAKRSWDCAINSTLKNSRNYVCQVMQITASAEVTVSNSSYACTGPDDITHSRPEAVTANVYGNTFQYACHVWKCAGNHFLHALSVLLSHFSECLQVIQNKTFQRTYFRFRNMKSHTE